MRFCKYFLIFTFSLLLCTGNCLSVEADENLEVWASPCGGEFQSGIKVELNHNKEGAKIFWTVFPNGSPAVGRIYEKPIEIKRNTKLYFFAFTSEQESTLFNICEYKIESAEESNYLRILSINPENNTIKLKNWSKFPVDFANWQLSSDREEFALPNITLLPQEEYELQLDLQRVRGEIMLSAPSGTIKDRVNYPWLEKDEIWQRKNSDEPFSVFIKALAEKK